MITHLIESIDVAPDAFGDERQEASFKGAVWFVEVTADDLEEPDDLEFPLCQLSINEVKLGLYVITALKAGTFGGVEILGWTFHENSESALRNVQEQVKEWDFDEEANLPKPVPDGAFKIVDTDKGWQSKERYATEEDAEQVLSYDKRRFYSNLWTKNSLFCEIVIDSEANWRFDHEKNGYRWFPKCVCLEAAMPS